MLDGAAADAGAAGISAGRLVGVDGWSGAAVAALEGAAAAVGGTDALLCASASAVERSGAKSANGNRTFERWRRRMIGARCITSGLERKADRADDRGKPWCPVLRELFEKRFDVSTHGQKLLVRTARVDRSAFLGAFAVGLMPGRAQPLLGARDREPFLIQ